MQYGKIKKAKNTLFFLSGEKIMKMMERQISIVVKNIPELVKDNNSHIQNPSEKPTK